MQFRFRIIDTTITSNEHCKMTVKENSKRSGNESDDEKFALIEEKPQVFKPSKILLFWSKNAFALLSNFIINRLILKDCRCNRRATGINDGEMENSERKYI